MNKLDLHGVRHQDVDMMVENFILTNQNKFPLTVICGNSVKMISLVETVTKRLGCETSSIHYGVITIGNFK